MVIVKTQKKILMIKSVYIFFTIIFIISAFFAHYFHYPPENGPQSKEVYYGWYVYIFGGWIGLIFIIFSLILLSPFKIRKAIISGIIGCGFIGFNVLLMIIMLIFFSPPGSSFELQIGFYLIFSPWITFIVINGILFKYREEKVISREEEDLIIRAEKLREKELEIEKREQALDAELKLLPEEGIVSDKIKIILSYSTVDTEYFQIKQTGKFLEKHPEISKIIYWEVNGREYVKKFLEETLKLADVLVLFCSENSNRSEAMKAVWQTAFQLRDEGLVKIVPVYENEYSIPSLLMPILNVKFTKDDLVGFIQTLYREILR